MTAAISTLLSQAAEATVLLAKLFYYYLFIFTIVYLIRSGFILMKEQRKWIFKDSSVVSEG